MLINLAASQIVSLLSQAPPNPGGLTPEQIQQIALEVVKRPGNTAEGILALLVPFGAFALAFLILWLFLRYKQTRLQARADFHKQLLDKFTSGREFADFLESKGSQRFLQELWSQSIGPKDRILNAMRNGIVLAVLGLGLVGLSFTRGGLLVPAVIVLALGFGFLISTAVSHRLSRKWDQDQKSDHGSASVS